MVTSWVSLGIPFVAILGGLGAMLGRLGGFFDETIEGQFFDNSSMN